MTICNKCWFVGNLTVGRGKRHVLGMPECEAAFKKVDDILSEALATKPPTTRGRVQD
jgi:hypothetical protein